jgi:hypothetical protein
MAVFLAFCAKNTAISGSIRYIGQVIKPEVIPLPSLSVAELVEAMSVKAGAETIPCSPRPARGTRKPHTELVGSRACRWPSLSRPCLSRPVPKQSPVPLDLLGERTIRIPSLSVAELVEAMPVEAMPVKAGADVSPVPLDLLGERTNRRPSLSRPGCSQNIGKQENIKPGYNDNLILTAIRSALLPLLFPLKDTP